MTWGAPLKEKEEDYAAGFAQLVTKPCSSADEDGDKRSEKDKGREMLANVRIVQVWLRRCVQAAVRRAAGAPDKSRQTIAFFRTVCISTLSAFALAHSAYAVSPLIDKINITVPTRGRTDFWNLPIGVWEYFVEVCLFTLKSRQEMPLHRSYCRRGVANSLSTSTARMGQRSVM